MNTNVIGGRGPGILQRAPDDAKKVYGNNPYLARSNYCNAARHSGAIPSNGEFCLEAIVEYCS